MGTASTTKFIRNLAGVLTERAALTTSAGADDAHAVPALNAAGVLDLSIVNGKNSSAGASDAGKLVALDASGRIDETQMPAGLGADTASIMTSEALAAGDFINLWNSAGAKVRKADATVVGKEAHGFVLAAFGSGVAAKVYFDGTNTAVTGQTPGVVYLATTAGLATTTAPAAAGNVVQGIGFATGATSINFDASPPIVLA